LVYDEADGDNGADLAASGVRSLRTRTVMRSDRDRRRLAAEVLAFGAGLIPGEGP
jgi:hypothetical protein